MVDLPDGISLEKAIVRGEVFYIREGEERASIIANLDNKKLRHVLIQRKNGKVVFEDDNYAN